MTAMAETTPVRPDVEAVRAIVGEHFRHLWTAVDLALATCATLLLAENTNPTAVILVGGPSTGKTTVATMFEGVMVCMKADGPLIPLCERSDKFTPASFVSQAANLTAQQLAGVDLMPKIKDKVLLTPELAPIFRGDDDTLTSTFSTVTRVLDGQGLITHSGTHGRRGSSEPHLFAWIGCTTPLPERAWRIMGQLGSRLFFLLLETSAGVEKVEDLLKIGTGIPYSARLKACKAAVGEFLRALFEEHKGIRSVSWDASRDEEDARRWLTRCAMVLAAMRSVPVQERDESKRVYRPGDQEAPYRALAVLTNVSRGRALVHGRHGVTMDDVPLIVRVALSSMPSEPGALLRAAISSKTGSLTVGDVKAVLGTKSAETARDRMRYMDALRVMEFHEEGTGKAATLRFRPDWEWCASPEFRTLLDGEERDTATISADLDGANDTACHS